MLINCGSPDCELKSAERLKAKLAEAAAGERDAQEKVQPLTLKNIIWISKAGS